MWSQSWSISLPTPPPPIGGVDVREFVETLEKLSVYKSSVESQKDVNAVHRCSIENQKGAIAVQSQWW